MKIFIFLFSFIVGIIVFVYLLTPNYRNYSCDKFNDTSMRYLPARCLKYFLDK